MLVLTQNNDIVLALHRNGEIEKHMVSLLSLSLLIFVRSAEYQIFFQATSCIFLLENIYRENKTSLFTCLLTKKIRGELVKKKAPNVLDLS